VLAMRGRERVTVMGERNSGLDAVIAALAP
jgi:hypothetical protein